MHILFLAQVAFCTLSYALALIPRATICNGHAELCERSFGNVSFVGAHNSYAVGVNNLAVNQDYDVAQQLLDGIRMLQLQVHDNAGVLTLCHSTCSLYKGDTLEVYLDKVKTWLDANPNEVLSILIVNIDNKTPFEFDTIYKAARLDTVSYSPPRATLTYAEWPTLGSMIDAGTRLVTFLDNSAEFSSVPYLINEFTNIWEDAFDVLTTDFDCTINRTRSEDTTNQMYLINHFLDTLVFNLPVPDVARANQTNAATGVGSLGQQVQTCVAMYAKPPNFMLVDFYEYGGGSVFQVAADINGVSYKPTSAVPLPKTQPSGSATPTSTPGNTSSTTTSQNNGIISLRIGGWQVSLAYVGIALSAIYSL